MKKRIKKKLGTLLFESGVISAGHLEQALTLQKQSGLRLGKILIDMGSATEEQIAKAIAEQMQLPLLAADALSSDEAKALIPKEAAIKKLILPIEIKDKTLWLAMANPLDWETIDELGFRTGLRISPLVARESFILESIERQYGSMEKIWDLLDKMNFKDKIEFINQPEDDKEINVQFLYKSSEAPPIVKLVTIVIIEAVKSRATDIHIEPREGCVKVRYRIDGTLREILEFPRNIFNSVISRIKIISNLDITKRRTPQDGSTHLRMENHDIDLRVSTLPSVYGEKIVIRILDRDTGLIPLTQLGIPGQVLYPLMDFFTKPQGMLVATGPTSSGKSTTLYACLRQLRSEVENVVTIEDPVEYKLEGITQVGVNEAVGLTFPKALRSILRQDPDTIMVGEIRDLETAEIAIKAALTGHLVLSTLHTNDAVSTITRLIDMGVPHFLVNSAVTGVLAQRLVRKICEECKVQTKLPSNLNGLSNLVESCYMGKGCKKCSYTGFYGQIGVYEYLGLDVDLRRLLSRKASEEVLRDAIRKKGISTLFDDAVSKINSGLTTVEEVIAKVPLNRHHEEKIETGGGHAPFRLNAAG